MSSEPTIVPRAGDGPDPRAALASSAGGENTRWTGALVAAAAVLALIGSWAYLNVPHAPETVALVLFVLLAGTVALALTAGRYAPGLGSEPQRFGLYRLEGKIEEGGVATVHRAVHAVLKRPTAVKVLKPHLATDELIARFEREVMLASRLQHPATVEIYDYGRTREGTFYFAMEYIDGLTLAKVVELDGPQPVPRVAHVLKQVCESLREAHGKGLVHRDMKPQNIMLAERGGESDVVKVLDWGLIKDVRSADHTRDITRYARFLGTPAYMPPERVRDPAQAGPAVDIYGLGAVAYFLLTGRRLFDAPNEFDLTRLVVEADAPRVADNAAQPIPPAPDESVAIYGPTTMLVVTVGTGVHGFTLEPQLGEFILTHPAIRIPPAASEFAINASNSRFWEPAVKRYVDECLAGRGGPRGRDFNMRWVASLVAETHRILMRGGVFLYPRDTKDPAKPGRLRLLYEANPVSFIVEQAGGRASTGRERMLEVRPAELHQRIGFIFGSREEVERIDEYHRAEHQRDCDAPLFGARGLFRAPA